MNDEFSDSQSEGEEGVEEEDDVDEVEQEQEQEKVTEEKETASEDEDEEGVEEIEEVDGIEMGVLARRKKKRVGVPATVDSPHSTRSGCVQELAWKQNITSRRL